VNETTVLTASIAVLSAILVVVGIYSVLVLRDFRNTIRKINKILGNTESVSELVVNGLKPAGSLANVLLVLKDALQIIHEMKELTRETRQTAQVVSQEVKQAAHSVTEEAQEIMHQPQEVREPQPVSHDIPKPQAEPSGPVHRFFKRH
jgi:hypothetical protein